MTITPEVLDAMVAAGVTRDQLVAILKADYAAEQQKEPQGPRQVPASMRHKVLSRDNRTCVYCGAKPQKLYCDHVIPYSRGGRTHPDNLAAACLSCNASKKDRTPGEWNGRAGA